MSGLFRRGSKKRASASARFSEVLFCGGAMVLLGFLFFAPAAAFSDQTAQIPAGDGTSEAAVVEANEEPPLDEADLPPWEKEEGGALQPEPIPDPLEPFNRAMFHVNDKLYFWFFKPLATAYDYALPAELRSSFDNFFRNIEMPIRAVNCLLQGRFKDFGNEIARFLINSTIGVAGFGDAAKIVFHLEPGDEDFGQTLGRAGMKPLLFINWPIFGPSSVRDTIGRVGDGFLNPANYILSDWPERAGVPVYDRVNETSLSLGEYESFKRAALDPYVAMRDAYNQYREQKVRE